MRGDEWVSLWVIESRAEKPQFLRLHLETGGAEWDKDKKKKYRKWNLPLEKA